MTTVTTEFHFRIAARPDHIYDCVVGLPKPFLEKLPQEAFDDAAELEAIFAGGAQAVYASPDELEGALRLSAELVRALQTAGLYAKFEFGKNLTFHIRNHQGA